MDDFFPQAGFPQASFGQTTTQLNPSQPTAPEPHVQPQTRQPFQLNTQQAHTQPRTQPNIQPHTQPQGYYAPVQPPGTQPAPAWQPQYPGGQTGLNQRSNAPGGINGFLNANLDGPQSAFAQTGLAIGRSVLENKVGGVMSWARGYHIKYYFTVDNRYVLRKLRMILFPLGHQDWKRQVANNLDDAGSGVVQKPPTEDFNAPDLYIPTMAFVTWCLVISYQLGVSGEFTPEVLGLTASSTMVWLCLELLICKFGFYAFAPNIESPALLDLLSYAGYKYVGLIISMVIGALLGPFPFYLAVLFFAIMNAIFTMRTLKGALPDVAGPLTNFLLILGGMQILLSFILILWHGAIPESAPATVVAQTSGVAGMD